MLQIKAEAMRVNKLREQTAKKIKQLEDQRAQVENERDSLKLEISSLEHELEAKSKETDLEKKKFEELVRERDVLTKLRSQVRHVCWPSSFNFIFKRSVLLNILLFYYLQAESATHKQVDLIKINENTKRTLEQEIQGYKIETQRQSKLIYQLEKEREKYSIEASDAAEKYMQALEEVKMREMAIIDLQKRITEGEGRLKQQQNLYEAVRADRNLYSKNLIEAQVCTILGLDAR